MSVSKWLKSTQRRVKETILQSVGAHDKTDDGIFDEKYQSFTSFTRDLAKVHLSMQLWLDSIDLMCASTVGIGESLATFCTNSSQGEETPLLDVARAFHAIGSDFNTIVRSTMRSTFIDRCMKPIESILAVVPVINEKIQKRKNIRLDADFYRSKLSSEQSTGKADDHPVILKLSSKLKEATNSLNTITSELIDCIDELHSQREFMLGPEIAAMIACMQTFNSYSASHLSQLSPLMPQSASTSCLLLATFESQRKLASYENIDSLRKKESFPMQPVFIRPSAQGGTVGGYGYTPLIDDTVSRVSSLLQCASNSVVAAGGVGACDGVAAASGSGDVVSGSKKEARSSAPASLGSGVVSGKRPVIKLGSDTPTAGAGSAGTTPSRVTSMAIPSKRESMSALSESTPRPLSMPSPSHERESSGSILENSFIPAPRSSGKRPISNRQHGKRTSINSLRLTASAAALSGSPKASLGIASGQSLIENDPEADDDTEWKSWGDSEGGGDQDREEDGSISSEELAAHSTIRVSGVISSDSAASIDAFAKDSGTGTAGAEGGNNKGQGTKEEENNVEQKSLRSGGGGVGSEDVQVDVEERTSSGKEVQVGDVVVALFKYESEEASDLCFEQGQEIEVISKDDSGWWEGRLDNGKAGMFPANYVGPKDSGTDS